MLLFLFLSLLIIYFLTILRMYTTLSFKYLGLGGTGEGKSKKVFRTNKIITFINIVNVLGLAPFGVHEVNSIFYLDLYHR